MVQLSYNTQMKLVEAKVITLIRSWYLLEDYRDYIKGFEWNVKKYMYSKPLLELCGEITKVINSVVANLIDDAQIWRNVKKRNWSPQPD